MNDAVTFAQKKPTYFQNSPGRHFLPAAKYLQPTGDGNQRKKEKFKTHRCQDEFQLRLENSGEKIFLCLCHRLRHRRLRLGILYRLKNDKKKNRLIHMGDYTLIPRLW